MKLLNNKILRSLLLSLILLVGIPGVALASAPQVVVKVQDERGVPIPGVMVKWTDKNSNVIYQPTTIVSYQASDEINRALTINPGEALFRSWDIRPDQGGFPDNQSLQGPPIDHDFDPNTPTVPQWFINRDLEGWDGRFGCGQNTHTFTAIPPKNMGLTCAPAQADLKNQEYVNRIVITCQRSAPQCPGGIKQVSCNEKDHTVTVSWDAPPEGADGYRFYLDAKPFNQTDNNDFLNQDFSNNLSRTVPIKYDLDYILHLKSTRTVNGQELQSDPSCLAAIRCDSTPCVPGTPNCPQAPCPGGNCGEPKAPTATFAAAACATGQEPYYQYTLNNINTYGLQFDNAKIMLVFYLNAQTQQILTYLSGTSSTADFSQWSEQHRQKQTGDYFGFYIQTFTSLPSNNSLSYRIVPSTRIGKRSMTEFQQFLDTQNLSTSYIIKANMTSKSGGTFYFNSHIPAPKPLDLSTPFDQLCKDTTTPPTGGNSCPAITITKPAQNEVLTPVNNKVTVTWSATGTTSKTQYEIIVFDKKAYSSDPAKAYAAYQAGLAKPSTMPNNLKVYISPDTEQEINFAEIDGLNPVNWMFAVRGTGTDSKGAACAWVDTTPLAPGFPVSGKIYEYNPACQPLKEVSVGGSIAVTPGTNPAIAVTGGSYLSSLPQSDLPYTFQLSLNDPAYSCANICGQGPSCVRDNITSKNNTANFFVSQETVFKNSWWQVFGGHVFSQNVMDSELPNTETNHPWLLMMPLVSGINETAGVPITNFGAFGRRPTEYNNLAGWLRDPALQAASAGIDLKIKPDYNYYRSKFDGLSVQLPDEVKHLADLKGQTANGVTVYYKEGSLKIDPDALWEVSGNQDVVVLVNGNITFSSENLLNENAVVLTRPGSTTTFIASGDIIFSGNVGNQDLSATPNMSGIFIGKRIIVQGGEDKRFVGEGTFIGWNGVLLQRQYGDKALNETTSTETFVHRPDFVINFPDILRDSNVTWKEVN